LSRVLTKSDMFMTTPDTSPLTHNVGLYIHIPFCLKKCNYCDFFSVPLPSKEWLDRYTIALLEEIRQRAFYLQRVQIKTIYIGGGTPSLLTGKQLESIIRTIHSEFAVKDQVEVSIEANPATVDDRKIKEIIDAGINRLSLGVQSFFDEDLRLLSRIHNSLDVMQTVEKLHTQGLENFNIDLIFGIPGQNIDRWRKTLQLAVDCNPKHISTYLLQLDASTPLAQEIEQGTLELLDEDTEWHMYNEAIEYLQDSGFEHYEISNFCRPGFECKHNLVYWQAEEYVGIGTGAVSFINARRYINKEDVKQYLNRLQKGNSCIVEELEHMNSSSLLIDAIILGLRLCRGISVKEFKQRFGINIEDKYSKIISDYISKGLLKLEDEYLKLTKRGYFLSNEVFCQFID